MIPSPRMIDLTATTERTPPSMQSIESDPEMFHGLTMWCGDPDSEGVRVSAQIRDAGQLALKIGAQAQVSTEDGFPAILPAEDARKLRDLLNVATARGAL